MSRLPRRLMMWGGAAIVAGASFAYMDSNTVSATSAGEGQAAVTGYTVVSGSIKYNPGYPNNAACDSWSGQNVCYLKDLSFTLQSDAAAAPANAVPQNLTVSLLDGSSKVLNLGNLVSAFNAADNWTGCTITGWTANAASANSGTVTCRFPTTPISSVKGIDVLASQ